MKPYSSKADQKLNESTVWECWCYKKVEVEIGQSVWAVAAVGSSACLAII